MAFFSGNGGGVTINGGTELPVGNWEVDSDSRDTENTHSGTGGSTNYEHVVYDNKAMIEIPWDDTRLPDTDENLIRGTKVTVVFQYGASAKTCTLTNALVSTCKVINNQSGDIVRVRVTLKGGAFTPPTT